MKKWLERQIEKCDEIGGMENEKWAFQKCYQKLVEEQKEKSFDRKEGESDFEWACRVVYDNTTGLTVKD